MNVKEFKQAYPNYKDVPDEELAAKLYSKYYSDKMDYNKFLDKFLTKPKAESSFFQKMQGVFVKGQQELGRTVALELPKSLLYDIRAAVNLGIVVGEKLTGNKLTSKELLHINDILSTPERWLQKRIDEHKRGQEIIFKDHPEWRYNPPKSTLDLLTNPKDLILTAASSLPLLFSAGVAVKAGQPQLAFAMIYAAEGQDAANSVAEYGGNKAQQEQARLVYGTVAAWIEQWQIEQGLKLAPQVYRGLLNSMGKKIIAQGNKGLTNKILKTVAAESLQEMLQGQWQETTIKKITGKEPKGGLAAWADRRASEALVVAALTLGTAGAGGMAATIQNAVNQLTPKQEITGGQRAADIKMLAEAKQEIENISKPIEVIGQPDTPVGLNFKGFVEYKGYNFDQISSKSKNQKLLEQLKQEFETYKTGEIDEQTIAAVVEAHNKNGNSFISLKTGKPVIKGYAIAIPAAIETIINSNSITSEDVIAYKKEYADLLEKYPDATIGTRTENGKTVFNILRVASNKAEAIKTAQRSGQYTIFDLKNMQDVEVPIKGISRKKALYLGHQIPELLGWSRKQRINFQLKETGKESMRKMNAKERGKLISALLQRAKKAGIEIPGIENKEDIEITVNGKPTPLSWLLDNAVDAIINAKGTKKAKRGTITKKAEQEGKGFWSNVKNLTIGIDNLHVSALANILSGGKASAITDILVDERLSAIRHKNIHQQYGIEMLRYAFKQNGITDQDLLKFSRSLNPRFAFISTISENLGIKPRTEVIDIDINGKTYSITPAEALDIYLSAQQEDGMLHLKQSGLEIFGEETGPLSDETIERIRSIVENRPKLRTIGNIMVNIAVDYDAPAMNEVSNRMDPEYGDIANEKNYWHLRLKKIRRAKGKETYSISMLENKGLLKPRKHTGKGALVLTDAFDKFVIVQQAISEYVGMAEHIRNVNMLLNYDPLIKAIDDKGYSKVRHNIIDIYERAQAPAKPTGTFSRILSRILRGSYRAVLTANPKVILSQYTSTIHYSGIVDSKYLKDIGHLSSPETIKEMLAKSPTAWERYYMGHQSIEMAKLGELDTTLKTLTGKTADINKIGLAIKMSDLMAFADGWKIAKAVIEDTTNYEKGSQQYWDAVNEYADKLWQETQPSWDKWNRSMITSNPTAMKQTFFLFRSYYEKALSMLHNANTVYQNSNKTAKDKARLAKVYGSVLSSQAINSIIRGLVGWGLWRKRKTFWDFIADMIAAPFAMVALVGKGIQISIRNFIKTLQDTKPDYSLEPVSALPISIINMFMESPDRFAKAAAYYIRGEEDKAKTQLRNAIKGVYESIGLANGIPVYELQHAREGWFKENKKKGRKVLRKK